MKKIKNKYIVIGLTGLFVLVSGVCYSCSYKSSSVMEESGLSDNSKKENLSDEKEVTDTKSLEIDDNATGTTADASNHDENEETQAASADIYVHVCGAVINPGVYKASKGSRIVDMIKLAGGLTKTAAGDFINQALPVSDGERIYIPSKKEIAENPSSGNVNEVQNVPSESVDSSLININTADATTLMTLPGIGEAKADSIIAYRTENGNFKNIEDIKKVSGIKDGLLNQISSKITVK